MVQLTATFQCPLIIISPFSQQQLRRRFFHNKRNIIEMKVGIQIKFLFLFKYAIFFIKERKNFSSPSLTHLRMTIFLLEIKQRTKLWNNNLHSIKMMQFTLNILPDITMGNAEVLSPVVLTASKSLLIYKFEEGICRCLPYQPYVGCFF